MDIHNSTHFSRGVSPVATAGDDTAVVSQVIDRAGFEGVEFVILTGAIPDANVTYAVLVEHGDTSAVSSGAVADADLIGTEAGAAFIFDDDDQIRKIGYKGNKRFVRVTMTPTGNTGATLIAGVWVLSGARKAPTASLSN